MKKNIILRLALWLLIAAWLSNTLLGGTVWAKYVAQGKGEGKARAAAFSVRIWSDDYRNGSWFGHFYNNVGDPNDYNGYWHEIVVPPNSDATFDLPLFDTAYHNADRLNPTPTVQSKTGELVVAPGTGSPMFWGGNSLLNNPNYDNEVFFPIKNFSEVAVSVKAELVSATLPDGLVLLLGLGGAGGSNISGSYIALSSATVASLLPLTLTMYDHGLPGNSTNPVIIPPYTSRSDDAQVIFHWHWMFDNVDTTGIPGPPPQTGEQYGQYFLGGPFTINDAVDTALGKQAAAAHKHAQATPTCGGTSATCPDPTNHVDMPEISLKFKITIEQVD